MSSSVCPFGKYKKPRYFMRYSDQAIDWTTLCSTPDRFRRFYSPNRPDRLQGLARITFD